MVSRSNRWSRIHWIILPVTLVCLTVWLANVAQAGTISLTKILGSPDITTTSIAVDYVYDEETDTGHFTAHSDQSFLFPTDDPEPSYWINNDAGYNYYLDMYLDSNGNLKEGATSTISYVGDMWQADYSDYLVVGPTLLTGTLSQFGFTEPGEQLEFKFNITDGNLQTPYFPTLAGMWMHYTSFNGDWTHSFSDSSAPLSDFFNTVPEPSSWVLLSTLIAGGWMAYRRQRVSR